MKEVKSRETEKDDERGGKKGKRESDSREI